MHHNHAPRLGTQLQRHPKPPARECRHYHARDVFLFPVLDHSAPAPQYSSHQAPTHLPRQAYRRARSRHRNHGLVSAQSRRRRRHLGTQSHGYRLLVRLALDQLRECTQAGTLPRAHQVNANALFSNR